MKKIVFITSQAFSLYNFRGGMIADLVSRGFVVYAMAPDYDDNIRNKLIKLGAETVDINLNRGGLGVFDAIHSIYDIFLKLRKLEPDILIAYFIKPIVFGLIASRFVALKNRIAIIEGLGYAFSKREKWYHLNKMIIKRGAIFLYKISLSNASKVFFLNSHDLNEFVALNIVSNSKVYCLGGIGVDLSLFKFSVVESKPITFIMVARLLREKGVIEYVEAARIIKSHFKSVRFILLGDVDSNPTSLTKDILDEWVRDEIIEWPGQVEVVSWLKSASVFVLPSFYREGVPRSIQEAMATGLPIITSDIPGCRDTVLDGVNGFLIPPRDPVKLAEKMIYFINNPSRVIEMGRESRILCEQKFDQNKVNNIFFKISNII